MMQALETFVGEPLRRRRMDLAWYRLSQLLHERTNGGFDSLYMKCARYLRPKVGLHALPQPASNLAAEIVSNLRRDGYMILPEPMATRDVEEIRNFAFSTPGMGNDLSRRIAIAADNIPDGQTRYYWWMDELATVPAVQRLIAEGPYCAIAQEYLGCRPVLAHITLFLDRPFEGKYEAYEYHYDNEGPGFLKFFFFLTEVDVGTGAHYFMSGTQPHVKPERVARATVYEAEKLYEQYGRDKEVIVRGPAGTILAEDTSGFHRGSKIERGYRLMMQFEFSSIDVPTDQELFRKLVPAPVAGLHPGVASIVRKFFVPASV
jgi:hypothetical protein